MNACGLKKLLEGMPDNFRILIDGEYPSEIVTVDFNLGYLILQSVQQEVNEED